MGKKNIFEFLLSSSFTLTESIHVHGLFNALLAPLYAGATVSVYQRINEVLLFFFLLNQLIILLHLKVEFLPKFSVRGIWQRFRESYPEGSHSDEAITVFTGVSTLTLSYIAFSHRKILQVWNLA